MGEERIPAHIREWLQREADLHHGGDRLAAVVAVLQAAWESERRPADPWAYVEARQRGRHPDRG